MSQLEQSFRAYLLKHPEIAKCHELINRRSLARHLIKEGCAQQNQMEALIAMLRRFEFERVSSEVKDTISGSRLQVKDQIRIVGFEKNKQLLNDIQSLVSQIDYDRSDTFKVVVGSSSITLFVDEKNSSLLAPLEEHYTIVKQSTNVSELSVVFSEEVVRLKGTLAAITQKLLLHDIVIDEMLTSSSELILYVHDEYIMKAYELLKSKE